MNTTSLDMSRRLKEAGVKQKSKHFWVNSTYSCGYEGGDVIWLCNNQWRIYDFRPDLKWHETGWIRGGKFHEIHTDETNEKINNIEVYSAYLATELLELLPFGITINNYFCWLYVERGADRLFYIKYMSLKSETQTFKNKNLCDALGEMVLYLKKERII